MTAPASRGVHWRDGGHGPALVLLNGWSASGISWPSEWLRGLKTRYQVIRIDNRGSGWSRHAPTPFTMADLADDVASVLDEAEIERATVFGLSMGGMIAQEFAMRSPERLVGLVLAATAPPMPAYRPRTSGGMAWALMRPVRRHETLEEYFRSLWSTAVGEGFAAQSPEILDELVAQIVQRPTPRAMLVHQLRAVVGWGHAERLARVDCPTVVVHGTEDSFIDVSAGRRLAELIPSCRFVELPKVGHLIAHEAPEVAAELIDSVAIGHDVRAVAT
jgi:pimeloyl-ACP methyl ester carboxylesterase